MRQNALLQESAILKGTKAHMKKKQEQADFRAINKKCDSSSQTEYDDFGAWDRQSGWTLPISGTAKARNRWRRSLLYGSCPSCRGVGEKLAAVLFYGCAVRLLLYIFFSFSELLYSHLLFCGSV